MGNRSLTRVMDKKGKVIIELYRQYDGYPEGMGKELIDFIKGKKLVNGIGVDRNVFNGMYDFAAQLVSHLKGDQVGNVYLYPPSDRITNIKKLCDKYGVEYLYTINSKLEVKCRDFDAKRVDLKKFSTEL